MEVKRREIWVSFDDWWEKEGRFLDPDHSDVPWFDKRKALAEYAWQAATRKPVSVSLKEFGDFIYEAFKAESDCDNYVEEYGRSKIAKAVLEELGVPYGN